MQRDLHISKNVWEAQEQRGSALYLRTLRKEENRKNVLLNWDMQQPCWDPHGVRRYRSSKWTTGSKATAWWKTKMGPAKSWPQPTSGALPQFWAKVVGGWEDTGNRLSFLPCQSNTNYIELQKNEDLYVSYTLEYAMRFIAIQVLIQP